jgi:hypothetical protein
MPCVFSEIEFSDITGKLTRSALRRANSSGLISTAGSSGGLVEKVRNVSNQLERRT